ncbi:MAG: ferric reductase-like transmembrane domain-containing protein [Bacilli bacterium]|nr:ferric reductase-like transmembrane domain-containing protein [Bacilli bacterium]
MITLIFVTIISLVSYFFPKLIHKYHYILYGIAAFIALLSGFDYSNIITLGYLPLSFIIVVMYTGVLDKGKIRKHLSMVRAENAIIGIILLAPHGIGYIEYYLEYASLLDSPVPLIGIASFSISVPLFITSFPIIRKKFKYKEWKQIHLLAYLFYVLVFIHLLLINNSRIVIYIIIFGVYIILKGIELVKRYQKASLKKPPLHE